MNKENSSLIERDPIENSPFWVIKNEEGWFLTMGNYRITEPVESKIIALDKLKTEKWDIIMRMTAIITERYLDDMGKELDQKINKGL